MKNEKQLLLGLLSCMVMLASTSSAAVTSLGPVPYLSAADSPLLADPALDVVLEDFEDGLFNVPGVIAEPIENYAFSPFDPFVNDGRGIVVGPGPDTDSVDGDDGVIDGWGNGGSAYRSTASDHFATGPTAYDNLLWLSFQPNSDGKYPNSFGFVWTDGEPGYDPINFTEVILGIGEINADGTTTNAEISFPSPSVGGDNAFDGGTGEDRFVGATSDKGIVAVYITSTFRGPNDFTDGRDVQLFFELDHLQFGYTRVPEPGTLVLSGVSIVLLLLKRANRVAQKLTA